MIRKFLFVLFIAGCNSDSKETTSSKVDTSQAPTPQIKSQHLEYRRISQNELPNSISFKGNLVAAFSWNDDLGKSIVVFSSVPEYSSPKREMNEDEISAELHVARYLNENNNARRTWKWEGGVLNCPFDIVSKFITGSITITDLDKDGTAELCFQAMESCRSDVSPSGKKLLLVENDQIYTLKGLMWLAQTPDHKMEIDENNVNLENQPKRKEEWEEYSFREGRYESEKEFANAPPIFLQYARSQWLKFVKESFD